jgi:hypothetical protein
LSIRYTELRLMKRIRLAAISGYALLLLSTHPALGVVDQGLEIQGTNLVLSWPSLGGYQEYMIQYRPTLDPSTPWTVLTNNYFANSTNRTTCTLLGVVPQAPSEAGGGGGNSDSPRSPMGAALAQPTEPMATPANGTGSIVPLALYPPGFDLSDLLIFDPEISDWVVGSDYARSSPLISADGPIVQDGPQPDDPGGNDPPSSGFYRVWHIPDWGFNITNYTYDGPTFFPVDFADYMDRVADIQVLLDGQPISDAVFMPYVFSTGETNWGMGVYFDLFPSGTHQIQLQTTIRLNDEIGDDSVFLTLSNLPRTIVVDNEVTFTNWDDLIQTTNFTFHAQTKNNDTDWGVDIYDAWNNYVNGGSGHTSDGQISWTWDLTDTSGNPRDDIDSDPFFYTYITFTASTGRGTTRTTPAAQTAYPATGYWLFTYLDRYYLDVQPGTFQNAQTYYTTAMNGLSGGPSFRGIPNSTYPIKFGTNAYSQSDRDSSWAEVKARLYDGRNRNLYYHGHGNANTIGCDMHTFDTNKNITGGASLPGSKAYISSQSISNEITFNRYGGSRPYRFVWLDGCSTANGNWPGAFGVDKAAYDLDHYTNSVSNPNHRRPSAFVGWNRPVGTGGVWGKAQDAYNFRTEWMQKWYYSWHTEGLYQAFQEASQSANWPPSGESQLFGAMQVYGYTGLLMNGYNQKNDWRWP